MVRLEIVDRAQIWPVRRACPCQHKVLSLLQVDDAFADYTPSTAFFFPGQGAQTVGMAKVHTLAEHPLHKKGVQRFASLPALAI
jgi:hypothetical protein